MTGPGWAGTFAEGDVEVNIPETAQCYLQVADDELFTPDATYTIRSAGVLSQVGDPTDPTGAPEGGSLVTVGVERSAHSNAPTSPTSKAVLTAGGNEHEIPDERKDESTSYSRETTDGEPESISATLELPEVTLTAKE